MSHVTIATAPCSWGVWYADGSPSKTPWDLFLDQAAAAGYKAFEMGPDGYLPTEEAVLREELGKRGLGICSGTVCYAFDTMSGFEDFRPNVEALCKRLTAFGAKYLVAMDESDVGLYSEKKKDFHPSLWDQYFKMFKALGEYTQDVFGIETVFHPHIKSLIETEAEIRRLMDHTGLRLCFDTGHHAYVNGSGQPGDTSATDFMRAYPKSIAYLHFKNVSYDVFKRVQEENLDSDTAFDMDVMCDLPDGIIDYLQVKRVLDEIDFSGIGVVEGDMPLASNEVIFASAKRNLEYLREIGMIE